MTETKDLTAVEKLDFPKITKEDVKRFICKDATDNEIALFIKIANLNKLNPFKRELYLVKYGDNPAQIVTGYEVYLKRAERTKLYNGFKVWIEGRVPDMKACVEIYRKDWDKPLYHEVDYSEYVGRTKSGNITRFWLTKPKTMLKKVVLGQAFRFAFPDDLAGLPYTTDEIDSIDSSRISKEHIYIDSTPAPRLEINTGNNETDIQLSDSKPEVLKDLFPPTEGKGKVVDGEQNHISEKQSQRLYAIIKTNQDKSGISVDDVLDFVHYFYGVDYKGKKSFEAIPWQEYKEVCDAVLSKDAFEMLCRNKESSLDPQPE